MMETKRSHLPWFGVALILFGIVLLLRKLGVIHIAFNQLLWAFMMLWGIVGVSRGYTRNRRGKIFGGTVIFLYGLLFYLHSLDSVEIHYYTFLPATFLIFGMAFVMMYLNDLRDWLLLLPALLLCGVGILVFLPEFGYYYRWEVWEMVYRYWPVCLIVIGIAIIFRRRRSGSRDEASESSDSSSVAAP